MHRCARKVPQAFETCVRWAGHTMSRTTVGHARWACMSSMHEVVHMSWHRKGACYVYARGGTHVMGLCLVRMPCICKHGQSSGLSMCLCVHMSGLPPSHAHMTVRECCA